MKVCTEQRQWSLPTSSSLTDLPQASKSPSHGAGIREYDDRYISAVGNALAAFIASILPTLAILALYYVSTMLTRIGMVILFTSVFSLSLSLLAKAKKVEIFSATAAYIRKPELSNLLKLTKLQLCSCRSGIHGQFGY